MAKNELLKQLKGLSHRVGAKERAQREKALREASTEREKRATYILTEASIERLKTIAMESNRKIKDVAQEAINDFIKKNSNGQ